MNSQTRPNLLYIHTDQHNPFVTGCYGDPLVRTPHLDRLAASGTVFDATYCCSPICVPSRMSMLSGRHPYQNQVWTNEHILDPGIPTLAHAMGAAGYRPVLAGRMHSLGPDQLHGYAERLVGDHSSNYLGGAPVDRGVLEGTAGPDRVSLQKAGAGQSAYQVHDEYVTAAAIDYLNHAGVDRQSGQSTEPFNLTVGFMLPHAPFVARRPEYDYYRQQISAPRKPLPPVDEGQSYLRRWRVWTGVDQKDEEETLNARAAYWALVDSVDAMIGRILQALEENGLTENTLIVYTSDHGDMVGEHGLFWKHTFYEESVRVPLIVSWPGVVEAGQRCNQVVSALDVNATILDALGTPPLANGDGRSFLPLLTGEGQTEWDNVAFSEYCSDEYCPPPLAGEEADAGPAGCYQRMIRRDEWKYVYYHGQEAQLFNLKTDPDEFINLTGDPRFREIEDSLQQEVLNDWDPEEVARVMADKKVDNQIMRAWGSHIRPREQYRWDLRPGMNYLE